MYATSSPGRLKSRRVEIEILGTLIVFLFQVAMRTDFGLRISKKNIIIQLNVQNMSSFTKHFLVNLGSNTYYDDEFGGNLQATDRGLLLNHKKGTLDVVALERPSFGTFNSVQSLGGGNFMLGGNLIFLCGF